MTHSAAPASGSTPGPPMTQSAAPAPEPTAALLATRPARAVPAAEPTQARLAIHGAALVPEPLAIHPAKAVSAPGPISAPPATRPANAAPASEPKPRPAARPDVSATEVPEPTPRPNAGRPVRKSASPRAWQEGSAPPQPAPEPWAAPGSRHRPPAARPPRRRCLLLLVRRYSAAPPGPSPARSAHRAPTAAAPPRPVPSAGRPAARAAVSPPPKWVARRGAGPAPGPARSRYRPAQAWTRSGRGQARKSRLPALRPRAPEWGPERSGFPTGSLGPSSSAGAPTSPRWSTASTAGRRHVTPPRRPAARAWPSAPARWSARKPAPALPATAPHANARQGRIPVQGQDFRDRPVRRPAAPTFPKDGTAHHVCGRTAEPQACPAGSSAPARDRR